MSKKPFELMAGEQIVLKDDCVSRGGFSAYTDELILTNQRIIWINNGILGKCKGVENYPLSQVQQAILGKAKNGDKQLEIHMTNGIEAFIFQSFGKKKIQKWIDTISDQLVVNAIKNEVKVTQKQIAENGGIIKTVLNPSNGNQQGAKIVGEFVGDVAKSVLKPGGLSVSGITKGIVKASKKQIQKNATTVIKSKVNDELGISEIKEEFIDMGNELRKEFGFTPKTTEGQQLQQQQMIMNNTLINPNGPVDKQIETIKKLKELLDIGVLSQEEFEIKKKEVLGL